MVAGTLDSAEPLWESRVSVRRRQIKERVERDRRWKAGHDAMKLGLKQIQDAISDMYTLYEALRQVGELNWPFDEDHRAALNMIDEKYRSPAKWKPPERLVHPCIGQNCVLCQSESLPAETSVVHLGLDDQPHDGRRADCKKCNYEVRELERQVVCDHFWQTGSSNVLDVCMRCGATRSHGANVEITVEGRSLETGAVP